MSYDEWLEAPYYREAKPTPPDDDYYFDQMVDREIIKECEEHEG